MNGAKQLAPILRLIEALSKMASPDQALEARRPDLREWTGFSTIAKKNNQHLSQPPIQHTRQPST